MKTIENKIVPRNQNKSIKGTRRTLLQNARQSSQLGERRMDGEAKTKLFSDSSHRSPDHGAKYKVVLVNKPDDFPIPLE